MSKDKTMDIHGNFKTYIKDKRIQRIILAVLTIVLSYLIILNGAAPKKYKLALDGKSDYDITAPRDIVNTIVTEQNARKVSDAEPADMTEIRNASIEVINTTVDFIGLIEKSRKIAAKRSLRA